MCSFIINNDSGELNMQIFFEPLSETFELAPKKSIIVYSKENEGLVLKTDAQNNTVRIAIWDNYGDYVVEYEGKVIWSKKSYS